MSNCPRHGEHGRLQRGCQAEYSTFRGPLSLLSSGTREHDRRSPGGEDVKVRLPRAERVGVNELRHASCAVSHQLLLRLEHEHNTDKINKGSGTLIPKPLICWLRGLDLNQRPLSYEGNSRARPPHEPTENPNKSALPRRPVLGPIGGCFRRVFGER